MIPSVLYVLKNLKNPEREQAASSKSKFLIELPCTSVAVIMVVSGFVVCPGSGSGVVVLGTVVVISFVLVDEVVEMVELAFSVSVTAASCSISSAASVFSDTEASMEDRVLVDPTVEVVLVAGVVKAVVETFVVSVADTDVDVSVVEEVAETVLSSCIRMSTVVATGNSISSGTVKRSIRGL